MCSSPICLEKHLVFYHIFYIFFYKFFWIFEFWNEIYRNLPKFHFPVTTENEKNTEISPKFHRNFEPCTPLTDLTPVAWLLPFRAVQCRYGPRGGGGDAHLPCRGRCQRKEAATQRGLRCQTHKFLQAESPSWVAGMWVQVHTSATRHEVRGDSSSDDTAVSRNCPVSYQLRA